MKKDAIRTASARTKAKPRRKKGRFDGLPPSCTPVILAALRRERGRK